MSAITILGAGLVGSAIAIDLSKKHQVTAVDIRQESLDNLHPHGIQTIAADFTDESRLQSIIADADLVIGAVPGFLGFSTVEKVIRQGKNMVDISFFAEDAFALHEMAKEKGVTIVTDCGVAPGMGNILLGYQDTQMTISKYECLVGGLPVERQWPWEYKAVFSPVDVIEEYTRPARYVQNHQLVIREALSDTELVNFPGVGTLESWNSDGLRSLIQTMPHIPDMIEKTLRYPGSVEYLKVLRAGGFFSTQPIEVDGKTIRPLDVTSKLLFSQWKLKPGDEDFTLMRIVIEGMQNNRPVKVMYHLVDRFDTASNTHSMARTTGYTCAAVAELILNGKFVQPGINPPEYVGKADGCAQFVLDYLNQRKVEYQCTIE